MDDIYVKTLKASKKGLEMFFLAVMGELLSSAVMKKEIRGTGETVVLVPGGLTGWLSWEPHAKERSENYSLFMVQLINVDLGLGMYPFLRITL